MVSLKLVRITGTVSLKVVIQAIGNQNHGIIEGIVRITVLLMVVIEGSQNHDVI